jgi:hypothetical protein
VIPHQESVRLEQVFSRQFSNPACFFIPRNPDSNPQQAHTTGALRQLLVRKTPNISSHNYFHSSKADIYFPH